MKKYLDILLFTLLFFLIFSYFSGKNDTPTTQGVQFMTASKSYTVPADIMLQVGNYTSSGMTIDTCEDITVRQGGNAIGMPGVLCGEREITPGETLSLDLTPYYTLFETPGSYTFELSSGEQKYITQTEVKYRGTISKMFI